MPARRQRPPYSRLTPAQRGAITRQARAAGKDPARVHAALKGLETRQKTHYRKAVQHGKAARQQTEKKVSTRTFQARAQRARRLAEKATGTPERPGNMEGIPEREPLTLKALSRYRRRADDYEIDIEGHHETDGDTDIYAGK